MSATICIDYPDSANQLLSLISSMLTMTMVIEYLFMLWTINCLASKLQLLCSSAATQVLN